MDQLQENGMTVQAPSPALAEAMREATSDMPGEFVERVPEAGPIIEAFRDAVGAGS
jgi:hypothetical protein